MANETTQAKMREMFVRRWKEHDIRGMWFWGSWLLIRWNILPIIAAALGGAIGWFALHAFGGVA